MRLLILSQWYLPEPQELLAELTGSLQQLGNDVTVLTGYPNWPSGKLYPGYRIKIAQREKIRGVSVIRVPLYPNHSRSALLRIGNFLSFTLALTMIGPWLAPRIDIIHVIHPPLTLGWPAWLISRLQSVPFTYEIQDMWPETLRATGMLNNERVLASIGRYAKWVYKKASAIRVISSGFRDNLISKGVPGDKIHVIPNWVDTEFFQPQEPDHALACELRMEGRFNVMFAGIMGLAQGLDTALEAAELLRDVDNMQLVFVGDGADLSRLEEIAVKRHITNVRFLGRYPATEMPKLYALADVLFLHLRDDPLFHITIPHKVYTYLASGRPVLAAMAGDTADLVESAQAGVVCAPSDPEDLANAIRYLYCLPKHKLEIMGQNGRRAALDMYSRETKTTQINTMLMDVVKRHQKIRKGHNSNNQR